MIGLLLVFITVSVIVAFTGIAVGSGVVAAARRLDTPRPAGLLPAGQPRTVDTLQLRDAVTVFGETYLVEGSARMTEHGSHRWTYRVNDAGRVRWLYAAQRDTLRIWLLEEMRTPPFEGAPPERLTWAEVPYKLKTLGRADVQLTGTTDRPQGAGRVEYHHHAGPGDHIMVVERWGGETVTLRGRQVEPGAVELLPGDLIQKR